VENVDFLVIRNYTCEHDARIEKLLFHLKKLHISVQVVCLSRGANVCGRTSSGNISHESVQLSMSPYLVHLPRIYRRLRLFGQVVKILFLVRKRFIFRAGWGCDFDGFFLMHALKYFYWKRPKTIFEVYDPWSTMMQNTLIRRLETSFFYSADFLIMPAKDSRLKVEDREVHTLGNELIPPLANEILDREDSDFRSITSQPFILVGGSLSKHNHLEFLVEAARRILEVRVLVCLTSEQLLRLINAEAPPSVVPIGHVSWSRWLSLLSHANACWIYYDETVDHFQSHISPNKYWESLLFQTNMIVNDLKQFSDRVIDLEPCIVEIGRDDSSILRLEVAIKSFLELDFDVSTNSAKLKSYFEDVERQRDETVSSISNRVMLKP
jgi:hypothetical protein